MICDPDIFLEEFVIGEAAWAQSLCGTASVPTEENSGGMNSARSWSYAHGGIEITGSILE